MVCRSSAFTAGGERRERSRYRGDAGVMERRRETVVIVVPTRAGGPLAALGGGGEAGFGSPAPSSAQADPRTLRGDDGAGQGGRGRRHPGLVGVHPERQRCKNIQHA